MSGKISLFVQSKIKIWKAFLEKWGYKTDEKLGMFIDYIVFAKNWESITSSVFTPSLTNNYSNYFPSQIYGGISVSPSCSTRNYIVSESPRCPSGENLDNFSSPSFKSIVSPLMPVHEALRFDDNKVSSYFPSSGEASFFVSSSTETNFKVEKKKNSNSLALPFPSNFDV
jgi:hypothetical protein